MENHAHACFQMLPIGSLPTSRMQFLNGDHVQVFRKHTQASGDQDLDETYSELHTSFIAKSALMFFSHKYS